MTFVFNALGILGTVCFLAAYLLLQQGKLKGDDYAYLFLNLAGAVLLIISLLWEFNLAAFLLEAAWGLISLYGLWKRYHQDKAA